MKECIFCEIDKIKPNIIWESKIFFVKVGVGILAPGHIMLISKEHLSCFAALPGEQSKEFLSMKERIADKIKSNFSEPIIFEHGIYGQTVNHAHLHFIPNESEFYNIENIGNKIFKNFKSTRLNDLFEIRDVFEKEGSYIYLEEKNEKFVFHTKDQPKIDSPFRNEFTRLTGLYGLRFWQEMSEEEKQRNRKWVKMTKDVLRKF